MKTELLGSSQVVRQRTLNACTVGSNPTSPAKTTLYSGSKRYMMRMLPTLWNLGVSRLACHSAGEGVKVPMGVLGISIDPSSEPLTDSR